jgi:hypothetical protein
MMPTLKMIVKRDKRRRSYFNDFLTLPQKWLGWTGNNFALTQKFLSTKKIKLVSLSFILCMYGKKAMYELNPGREVVSNGESAVASTWRPGFDSQLGQKKIRRLNGEVENDTILYSVHWCQNWASSWIMVRSWRSATKKQLFRTRNWHIPDQQGGTYLKNNDCMQKDAGIEKFK